MPRINHLKKNILDGFKRLPEKVQISLLRSYGETCIEDILVKLESRPQRQFLENLISWSAKNLANSGL